MVDGPTGDELTTRLLQEVFPGSRVGSGKYLRWLYRDSPFGQVVETNVDDDIGRAAHYAVVPCEFLAAARPLRVALSLNTAVAERARGGGVFTRIAEETYTKARQRGIEAIVGVANANSTPGFLRRLRFTHITALPATVLPLRPGRGPRVDSAPAFEAGVGDDTELSTLLAASTDPQRGVEPFWTAKTLAWRLASPGNRYVCHRAPGLFCISTADRRGRVNVAVILATFADHRVGRSEIDAVVRSACRVHHAPVALHAGIHPDVQKIGVPLPTRLRPSPLNLIFRWLDDTQLAAPHIGRFEFLDFDAY